MLKQLHSISMRIVTFLIIFCGLVGCDNSISALDCAKLKGQELIIDFSTKFLSMSDSRFTAYITNEAKYSGEFLK